MRFVLVLCLATLALSQYSRSFGPDGSVPGPRLTPDERRARYRDDRGQLLNGDERRAFIQGGWDARKFARNNQFRGQVPADANLAEVYQRGQAAWRNRAATIPNSDKQKAPSYVSGVWPAMCPNNGMGLSTISQVLGQGQTSAFVTKQLTAVKRTRRCNSFSGCTAWVITEQDWSKDEESGVSNFSPRGSSKFWLSLFLTNNGQELQHRLASEASSGSTTIYANFVYAPKTPYSLSFIGGGSYNSLWYDKRTSTGLVFSGYVGNSCASFFTDVLKKDVGNAVQEYQYAIYGTF